MDDQVAAVRARLVGLTRETARVGMRIELTFYVGADRTPFVGRGTIVALTPLSDEERFQRADIEWDADAFAWDQVGAGIQRTSESFAITLSTPRCRVIL